MAHFNSPCMKAMLIKADSAPMPQLIQSTYQTDYISPMVRYREKALQAIAAMPPDYLDEDAGKRILPTTLKQFYHNCVSASIGDRLELQFTDDTPDWKRKNRAAAAANWIRPLSERRRFVETKQSNGRGGGNGGGGSSSGHGGNGRSFGGDGNGMEGMDVFLPGDQYIGEEGDIGGVVNGYITEITDDSFPQEGACPGGLPSCCPCH